MNLHVIAHTHWDREWHKTFQEYRVKLVQFMDDIIELLEKDEKFLSFMLDGQTIVIEDYLMVKPDMKDRIKDLVGKGRLVIGPWYIQPDVFIPSGESIIRNLLIGNKIGKEYGKVMKVGYLPDSFGISAQIPQILNGFGIDSALFWRGITEEDSDKSEFIWEAPDESKVFAINISEGYGNGRMLSKDINKSMEVINYNIDRLKERAISPDLLLMNGFDQRMANGDLPEIIDRLNKSFENNSNDMHIKLTKLENYISHIKNSTSNLKRLCGPFRKGKNMRVHISIGATRLDIKRDNFDSQILIEKYVEPINSLAYIFGGKYDNEMINTAWKYLIQNQAHDSICCVCTDETHKEMKLRYKYTEQIGNTILLDNIAYIKDKILYNEELGQPFVVFNTLTNSRRDIVEAVIYVEKEKFIILDNVGKEIPYQLIEIKDVNLADSDIEIGVKNPDKFLKSAKVKFLAEIEGYGYRTYYIVEGKKQSTEEGLIANEFNTLENEYLIVEIMKNGSLKVTDKENGKVFNNLNIFEEGGNGGDEYDFSPPRQDKVIRTDDSAPKISIINNGPICATILVRHLVNMPLDSDVYGRSDENKKCFIESYITLYRNIKRIDIRTLIQNDVKNHRIRALFDTNLKARNHISEQQFGVLKSDNCLDGYENWERDGWEERYYPIYPQQSFVDMSDGNVGLAILNKGLPQYEILSNEEPTIALTLLSSTDYMGKQDLIYRPGRRSGLHVETPDSLLLGIFETEYAIVPHSGDYERENTNIKAHSYTSPFKVAIANRYNKDGNLPDEVSLLKSQSNSILTSTIKKSEGEESIVWRIYNSSNELKENIQLSIDEEIFDSVELVDLKEEAINDEIKIKYEEGLIEINYLNPNEILNIKLKMKYKI